MSHVIEAVICAQMFMITIALNAWTDFYKIELLKLRNPKDASKLVQMERFSVKSIVRNVMSLATNALLGMIIIALSALMDMYKMQLINLKAPKNV